MDTTLCIKLRFLFPDFLEKLQAPKRRMLCCILNYCLQTQLSVVYEYQVCIWVFFFLKIHEIIFYIRQKIWTFPFIVEHLAEAARLGKS